MARTMVHDLSVLQHYAISNEEENEDFRTFLNQQDGMLVDEIVSHLNQVVSSQIDCTKCGNCCRSLMINIEPVEVQQMSAHLNMPLQQFKDTYVEESQQGQLVMNTIPCHFLHNNKCNVYEHRFTECREFPHLHKPGFINRLFVTFMHYGRCPIVFNVVEALKAELCFDTYPKSVAEV